MNSCTITSCWFVDIDKLDPGRATLDLIQQVLTIILIHTDSFYLSDFALTEKVILLRGFLSYV